jgi:hypothetical protein
MVLRNGGYTPPMEGPAMARPTTVQETAIRNAMRADRLGDATLYADRTLETMERNGWITRPDTYTYRVTPEAALALGQFTISDQYRREDLVANDPKAKRQAEIIAQAREAGLNAFAHAGVTETITISVEDLARLLAASHTPAYAA